MPALNVRQILQAVLLALPLAAGGALPPDEAAGARREAPETSPDAPRASLSVSSLKDPATRYVIVRAGGYAPRDDTFEAGFDGEIGVGTWINKHVAAEIALGRFESRFDHRLFMPPLGEGYGRQSVVPVTATMRIAERRKRLEAYALLGAGLYITHASFTGTSYEGYAPSASDTEAQPGVHAGLGLDVNVSSNTFVGGQFRYVISKGSDGGLTVPTRGVRLGGAVGFRF